MTTFKEKSDWNKTLLNIRASNFPIEQYAIYEMLEDQTPDITPLNRRQRRAMTVPAGWYLPAQPV